MDKLTTKDRETKIQFLKELSALLKKYDTYIWAFGEAELDSVTPITNYIGVGGIYAEIVKDEEEGKNLTPEAIDAYIDLWEKKST